MAGTSVGFPQAFPTWSIRDSTPIVFCTVFAAVCAPPNSGTRWCRTVLS